MSNPVRSKDTLYYHSTNNHWHYLVSKNYQIVLQKTVMKYKEECVECLADLRFVTNAVKSCLIIWRVFYDAPLYLIGHHFVNCHVKVVYIVKVICWVRHTASAMFFPCRIFPPRGPWGLRWEKILCIPMWVVKSNWKWGVSWNNHKKGSPVS